MHNEGLSRRNFFKGAGVALAGAAGAAALSGCAPAASQKAAFDQSPSARTAPGERYRCPPGMAQPSGSGSVAMPKRRSAASVMAI